MAIEQYENISRILILSRSMPHPATQPLAVRLMRTRMWNARMSPL